MGVGLAATQLGMLRRLLVFQAGPDAEPTRARQPRDRVALGGARDRRGGLPQPAARLGGRRAPAARPGQRPRRRAASRSLIEASGLEARVLQHEIDHLDGVLILDRTDARAAQGRAAGAARGRQLQPARGRGARGAPASCASRAPTREDRLPRHLRLRRHRPAAPGRLAAPPGARRHPARPPQGRGRQARRRPPAAAGARARDRRCSRPRTSTTRRRWSAIRAAGARGASSSAPSAS